MRGSKVLVGKEKAMDTGATAIATNTSKQVANVIITAGEKLSPKTSPQPFQPAAFMQA